jgi:hypothetical protein
LSDVCPVADYGAGALMARRKQVKLLAQLPADYTADFMERLDQRTVLGKAVVARFTAVVSDLGGEDNITTVKRSLARRFTWFEVMLEGMECRMAAGEQIDIGAWTQLTNSWLGIARMLGLERKAKRVRSLRERWDAKPIAEAGT